MLDLILGASWIVQLVLLVLVVGSVSSWAVIIFKARELSAARDENDEFLQAYLERPLDAVFDVAKQLESSPLAVMLAAGYRDLAQVGRLSGAREPVSEEQLDGVLKRLDWVQTSESQRLERGLSFLATTGSSAPFIGLFGTVVGIMNAFDEIGAAGSASLAVVAPGIAEALVATAVGLFAAIPAVIAYNYSSARVEHLNERLGAFRAELEASLRRAAARAA